jgi:tetratricopeptide (TPR) repeat protein
MKLIISDDEGHETVVPFARDEISIGRLEGNTIRLTERNISRRHARLIRQTDAILIEDLGSSNGVRVNGERIASPAPIRSGDVIGIGDYDLAIEGLPAPPRSDTDPNAHFPDSDTAVTEPPDPADRTAVTDMSALNGGVAHAGAPARAGFVAAPTDPSAPRAVMEKTAVTPPKPAGPSRTPMVLGVLAAMAVLAVVAAVAWPHVAPPAEQPSDELCRKGQAALAAQDWAGALTNLSSARNLGHTCSFSIETALQTATHNQELKAAMDQAEALGAAGNYAQAITVLQGVPADSIYGADARLKLVEVRIRGVRETTEKAREALEHARLDEASTLLEQLRKLDSTTPALGGLEKELARRRPAMTPKVAPSSAVVKAAPAPSAVPVANVTPPRPIDERNSMAEAEINDGVRLIKAGDFQGGLERLQSALAEEPDTQLLARAHRNMGLAYRQKGRWDDAISHLKISLKLQPDAPDAPRVDGIIKDLEAQRPKGP